ncbi:MAG: glucosaminidase domain-containing protein [Alphaproteobacteria bacterium]|tara:strand:- start:1709 stop:2665 length:957 start_codon:yes stop_codon:yes gene_type:complete
MISKTRALYRNLTIILISLVSLNVAVGFYKSFSKIKNFNSSSISFTVQDKSVLNYFSNKSTVDYISQAEEMIDIFNKYDFSVESFLNDQSSNLIIFSSWPKDFLNISSVNKRKKLFINTLLPIIFVENRKILEDRKKILDWWNQSDGESFSREFWPGWLFELSEKYNYNESSLGNLLIRVDIVPLSLVLSQAAIESGWGTSRYLDEGNAIFGQYTFDPKSGIKPKERANNKKFFIKKFANLSDSVRSYLKNINTHNAYESFRQERRKLRMNGETLQGNVLADHLQKYSERSNEYVKDIKHIIQTNNFMKFDKANGLLN